MKFLISLRSNKNVNLSASCFPPTKPGPHNDRPFSSPFSRLYQALKHSGHTFSRLKHSKDGSRNLGNWKRLLKLKTGTLYGSVWAAVRQHRLKSIMVAHAYPIHQVFMVSWRPPFFLPVESEGEHYWEMLIKSVDLALYSESFNIIFQDAN